MLGARTDSEQQKQHQQAILLQFEVHVGRGFVRRACAECVRKSRMCSVLSGRTVAGRRSSVEVDGRPVEMGRPDLQAARPRCRPWVSHSPLGA
jgi:hypothetical protein